MQPSTEIKTAIRSGTSWWTHDLGEENRVQHSSLSVAVASLNMCQSCSVAESMAVPRPVSCRTSPGKAGRRSTWPGKTGSRPGSPRCSWLPGGTCERWKVWTLKVFQWSTVLKSSWRGEGFLWSRVQCHYLSDVLVALFDVLRGAHDQLMNAVYLRLLLGRQSETRLTGLSTRNGCIQRLWPEAETHLVQDLLSKDLLEPRNLHHLPLDLPAVQKNPKTA